jgi:hypothetical protein
VSAKPISTLDLTVQEQEHVRNALIFLRAKLGTWKCVARVLHFEETTLMNAANSKRTITANMAFRLARLVKVKVDDLISGQWPEPGLCPRCGYRDERKVDAAR